MNFLDLVTAARTCRRYKASYAVGESALREMLTAAQNSPSARNSQVLRFGLVHSLEARQRMFGLIRLGGSLTPEQRPTVDQQPGGYIVIFAPRNCPEIHLIDVGIAAQSINLAATACGLATCMIATFEQAGVASLVECPPDLQVRLVIAVGSPDEERHALEVGPDQSLVYYRDENNVNQVPKLALDSLILSSK